MRSKDASPRPTDLTPEEMKMAQAAQDLAEVLDITLAPSAEFLDSLRIRLQAEIPAPKTEYPLLVRLWYQLLALFHRYPD